MPIEVRAFPFRRHVDELEAFATTFGF